MNLFVSIFCYPISKLTDDPERFVQCEIAAGEKAEWPCFRSLARLRKLAGPVHLLVDRATLVAKARSRAAHTFLCSDADVWVTIDDDIEVEAPDLKLLLSAMRDETSEVVFGACAMRGDAHSLNIVAERRVVRTTSDGTRLLAVKAAGAALVGYKRSAIEHLANCYPELWYANAPDDVGIGLFLEDIRDHHWMGEDMQFCARARLFDVRLEALLGTSIVHAGVSATISEEWLNAPEVSTSSLRPRLSEGATSPPVDSEKEPR